MNRRSFMAKTGAAGSLLAVGGAGALAASSRPNKSAVDGCIHVLIREYHRTNGRDPDSIVLHPRIWDTIRMPWEKYVANSHYRGMMVIKSERWYDHDLHLPHDPSGRPVDRIIVGNWRYIEFTGLVGAVHFPGGESHG